MIHFFSVLKREEYEYLQDINNRLHNRNFQPTVLRPPHADELALIGTIRGQNSSVIQNRGFQNLGFTRDNEEEKIPRIHPPSSQHWIELQPNIIKTAQLPPADYEIRSYPADDYYTHPHPTSIDFRQYPDDYIDDNNESEHFQFQSLRRPEIIPPPSQRQDTSTEFYGIHSSNTVPKSILKTGTNTTPPLGLLSNPYLRTQRSRTSSKYDDSPHTSLKTSTDQSTPTNYQRSVIEKRIPINTTLPSSPPLPSRHRMRYASVGELNDIEWEVPREFQIVASDNQLFNPNRPRISAVIVDPKIHIPWQRAMNISQHHSLSKGDITQQQAFEY